ncbi:hypothetical protein N9892_00850 [bacterium]|nr:hypothetical protein [Akkermansiaceae bacterium]MDB4277227.1 hypothetical protein [bacterium]MDB4142306.1 hypothetical protein [Akkermansiaceae bacterium]MDB4265941.1 hypothetical protein [Akkermansiaceae bacterium]MDB4274603.1 hypothetical protein [Akkermansiaceae bacterium]
MKMNLSSIILWASLLLPIQGQLPAFDKAPLLGLFAIHEHEDFTLQINEDAEITIQPKIGRKGETAAYYQINQKLEFREVMKNGRMRKHLILPESLTTKDEKSTKFSHVTMEGEAAGKIKFRYTITNKRGELTLQPEILNMDELADRKIQMVIQTRMGARYRLLETLKGKAKEQTIKNIADTTVTFHPAKNSKTKKSLITYAEILNQDAATKINGDEGFQKIITQGYFVHRKMCNFTLESQGPNASLLLEHLGRGKDMPLYRSHAFQWLVDATGKPEKKHLLRIELERD